MLIEFTEKACQVLFVLFWTLIVCTDLLRSYFVTTQVVVVVTRLFKQHRGTYDVRLHKGCWPVYGSVHMGLGCQVHNDIGLILGK